MYIEHNEYCNIEINIERLLSKTNRRLIGATHVLYCQIVIGIYIHTRTYNSAKQLRPMLNRFVENDFNHCTI